MKYLRHDPLDSNVFNTYFKFQVSVVHTKRNIYVQKIKVKKLFFRYIVRSTWELFVYLHGFIPLNRLHILYQIL